MEDSFDLYPFNCMHIRKCWEYDRTGGGNGKRL